MKSVPALLSVALALASLIFPVHPALAVDACAAVPCQNGGACTPVGSTNFLCGCTGGYLGPNCGYLAAPEEQITTDVALEWGGAVNFLGWVGGPDESGLGQSFRTSIGGILENVSFEIYVQPEVLSRPEDLIVEFWNVDGNAVPTGSPLASRTLAGDSLTASVYYYLTVDFSADELELAPNTQYAFTLRVLHKSTVASTGLYQIIQNYGDYTDGELVNSNGGAWGQYGGADWDKFQITVKAPMFEDGFEIIVP